MKSWIRHAAAVTAFLIAAVAQAAGVVGNTFPSGFPVIEDHRSLRLSSVSAQPAL